MVLVLALAACGGDGVQPPPLNYRAVYADLAVRLCDQARCGPSHPAFALAAEPSQEARSGIRAALPDAVFIDATDGLIGPDDRVIDGGRILHFGSAKPHSGAGVFLIDAGWESSRAEFGGVIFVYQWDGTAWVNVEPSTVGITVTTAAP